MRHKFIQARETVLSTLGSRLEQKEGEVKQREMEVSNARREAATKVCSRAGAGDNHDISKVCLSRRNYHLGIEMICTHRRLHAWMPR